MILITASQAQAAPFNNDDQVPTALEAINESIEPQTETLQPKKAVKKEPVLTWRDNPNKCDTDSQYIRADNFGCIDKPVIKKAVVPKKITASTSKQELMRRAGIPEYEWAAVNEIITRESGWKHQIWNSTGSGAYGLCQSLPASKMASAGADWRTNPVTQLRWCDAYADEYGGWIKAAQYSRCQGRCYSTKVGGYVYKDHKWW